MRALSFALACLLALVLLPACSQDASGSKASVSESSASESARSSARPESNGARYVDEGAPNFGDYAGCTSSFEEYASLDALGRCGTATACLGRDLMPTGERESISQVKPTGWHQVEYDFIEGEALYNRCHLIAFSLAGENANERNLITGTQQMNETMTLFETPVRDYINRTGNHVLYRVTPVFEGYELVARGVHMEAQSVEDGGVDVTFSVYIPNEQDGVEVDYATGYSWLDESSLPADASSPGSSASSTQSDGAQYETSYVLNTKSRRFHLPDCPSVADMSAKNRAGSDLSRDELIARGYKPCGSCNP